MDKCGSYSIQRQGLLIIEKNHCNVLVYHYFHLHHHLTAQASTPSTATPTNIELIEEDDILSFVEADNIHTHPQAVQWDSSRGRLPPQCSVYH